MASTYSFNCIIHYNFNDSDIKFSDSTALYSTSENINITTNGATGVKTVKLPLPDYLQGIEYGITWFSDAGAKTSPVSEKTEVNWILSREIIVGNFISYNAEVTLYTKGGPKTIDWKYLSSTTQTIDDKVESTTVSTTTWQEVPEVPKKEENESDEMFNVRREEYTKDFLNFIHNNAPKIPAWVIGKAENSTNDDPVYLFTFEKWGSFQKDLQTGKYSCKADYNSIEYSDTNRYTTKKTNIFEEAEPYHYGSGSPAGGYFLPIGEDGDDRTKDIKVQAPETNGYSTIKKLSGYKIKNKDLTYIEKGTFPITRLLKSYSSKYVTTTHNTSNNDDTTPSTSTGERDIHHCFCWLVTKYKTDCTDIESVELRYGHTTQKNNEGNGIDIENNYAIVAPDFDDCKDKYTIYDATTKNFTAHSDESCPKCLGFVLAGGGGGSGGISQIDPDKNKSGGDQYVTPGGGGGGGEIVYGVFDLRFPSWAMSSSNRPKDLALAFLIYLGCGGSGGVHGSTNASHNNPQYGTAGSDGWDSRIWVMPHTNLSGANIELLFNAKKGYGGGGGGLNTPGGGGAGGSGGFTCNGLKKNSWYKNCCICGRIPGGAGGPDGDSPTNKAFSHNIYFSKATPPSNNKNYCISLNYTATSGSKSDGTDRTNVNIPGGHSFGQGGHKSLNPSNGGGGCCKLSGGRDGCGGYFGIYY